MTSLAARDLSVAYERTIVLKDLDLEIPVGEITALVGSNGSGKSTLLKTMARLLRPRQGSVYLDNRSVFNLPTKEVAKKMGILPQGPVAPEGLSVRELVAQGRYPYQSWFRHWSASDDVAVQRALEATGLTLMADRPLDSLSGGQRQRAWIAMALAQETGILLLDEPTTYLDLAHQVEVLDLLDELNRKEGRTIVMVLHDLNQACRYVHHLAMIKDGGVYAAGQPSEIMTEDAVRSVFGLECRVIIDPLFGTPLFIPAGRRASPISGASYPSTTHPRPRS